MTNQEKKAWLNRYRESEAEAVRLEQEIERLYSAAEKTTTAIKMVPCGGAGERSMETAIEAIDAIAQQCGGKHLEAMRARREIEDAIARVPEGRLRILLRYRYLDGMKWERISAEMGFADVRWVYHLHGKALGAMTIEIHV